MILFVLSVQIYRAKTNFPVKCYLKYQYVKVKYLHCYAHVLGLYTYAGKIFGTVKK